MIQTFLNSIILLQKMDKRGKVDLLSIVVIILIVLLLVWFLRMVLN